MTLILSLMNVLIYTLAYGNLQSYRQFVSSWVWLVHGSHFCSAQPFSFLLYVRTWSYFLQRLKNGPKQISESFILSFLFFLHSFFLSDVLTWDFYISEALGLLQLKAVSVSCTQCNCYALLGIFISSQNSLCLQTEEWSTIRNISLIFLSCGSKF